MQYICASKFLFMKWGEFKKLAVAEGWVLKRNGSNHDIYFHPDKDGLLLISRHSSEEIKKRNV